MGLSTAGIMATAMELSTAAGVAGSIQQGQSQAAMAKYESQVASNNAKIAQQNAAQAGQAGENQAGQSEMKTRAQVGAIKASQAANGLDINSGSSLDVQSSAAEMGEQNAITIRSNAARTAYGYEQQAQNFQTQSELDKMQANNDEISSFTNAGSTLLGGAGKAAQYIGGGGMNAGSSY